MHTRPVRIIFFVFLVVVGTYTLLSPPPDMSAGPASELASFSREKSFTGVWEDLRRARLLTYRAESRVRESPRSALETYREVLSSYRIAREKARQKRYFKQLIDSSLRSARTSLDRLEERLDRS